MKLKVSNKNFDNGNIKFTVVTDDNEQQEYCIRMVEVFNDNFRDNVTYLRPIGFKINGFGTENQLYATEDFTETIIEVVRKLDKQSYRFTSKDAESICDSANLVPSFRVKMSFDKPVITLNDLANSLSGYGIEIRRGSVDDEVILHNLKDSISIELVMGLCSRGLSPDEASVVCKYRNSTEHYLCNVTTIGGIIYSLIGETGLNVDCDVFVSDPEEVYNDTVAQLKSKLAEF